MASAVSSVLLTPLPAAVRVGTMMEGWGILDEVPPLIFVYPLLQEEFIMIRKEGLYWKLKMVVNF